MALAVVVADDALIVREGVERVLQQAVDVEVVGTCADFEETVETVDRLIPDVLVTDIRMPPTGTDEGIRAANLLRERHPGLGIVLLSQYVEPQWALDFLSCGANGRAYLMKDRVGDPQQLLGAIRTVASGGSVVDPLVIEALIAARSRGAESALARLSPREREVLAEIAQGKNNAAIAEQLVLSPRAVEKHINSLFSKLGLSETNDIHRRVTAVLMYLDDLQRPAGR